MSSLNQCNLIGRLGRDVETRQTQNGGTVANFTIAISDKWKDKSTGENKEKTEWVRVVAFGRLGEVCTQYLTKGSLVFVSGKMTTQEWEKDGIKRYSTSINATTMQMLGGKGGQSGGQQQERPPQTTSDDIPF